MFLGSQGTGGSTVLVLTNSSGHEKSYSKFLAACFIKLGLYRPALPIKQMRPAGT